MPSHVDTCDDYENILAVENEDDEYNKKMDNLISKLKIYWRMKNTPI